MTATCAAKRYGFPRPVVFSLRAAVAATCNMACHYCPRYSSMENFTPNEHRGRGVTHDQYLDILTALLSALRFSSVSLTGGEPLINRHLSEIAEAARSLSDRLELNTNGLLVTPERWLLLAPWFDRVKVSLDTLDSDIFAALTEATGPDPLGRVLRAIDIISASGVELAINCVVCRATLPTLWALIDFAVQRGVRLHLLDYYFTDERRHHWEQQFVPIETIMPSLEERFGPPEPEPIFGCGFYRYTPNEPDGAANGAVIRIKTSYSGTMRAPRCSACRYYCQEGMYGLKLSTDGWVTTCPSNEQRDGVLLEPGMRPSEVYDALTSLITDLDHTRHDATSMVTLIGKHDLRTPARRLGWDRNEFCSSAVRGSSGRL